ncbi:unnamed protein product [Prorocentrum cordatum]|uniref:Uncharacterized protein n=1 Tax=Prorocentrum cordatum TaxID=2364126 RepID=A0ABN9PZ15_9DINO|nr:unnamed protein product [Polarella glacialis]
MIDNFKEAPDSRDVILTTRWYIADEATNMPLMFLPAALLAVLPPWGELGWATHNAVKPKLADDLKKFAAKISEDPYNIKQGAVHLVQWLDGTMETAPVLDASYMAWWIVNGSARRPALEERPDIATCPALDLEPCRNSMAVGPPGFKWGASLKKLEKNASKRAVFVYPLAVQIQHENPGTCWDEAVRLAEEVWCQGGATLPREEVGGPGLVEEIANSDDSEQEAPDPEESLFFD